MMQTQSILHTFLHTYTGKITTTKNKCVYLLVFAITKYLNIFSEIFQNKCLFFTFSYLDIAKTRKYTLVF